MNLRLDQLCGTMDRLAPERAAAFLDPLNNAMAEGEINTSKRAAAFLAQLAHESNQLRWFEEKADGSAYEPTSPNPEAQKRAHRLGNTESGDGPRFKGRGPIQLTGRANYELYGRILGVDLVRSPQLAASPAVGFRIAAEYWKRNGCNALADSGDFITLTRRINGGLNGLQDRERYWKQAKATLGVEE